MSKTYIQDDSLQESATSLAGALGLSNRSAQRVVQKFQVRRIADDEEVFTFTAKGKYLPLKVGRGLMSAVDVARECGLSLSATKSFLKQPYGTTPDGIYSCVLKNNWEFSEE